VQSYRESDDDVSVFSTCGQHVSGSVLIGADGINSVVRQQLIGDGGPRSAGITAYRSAVPIEKVPAALRGTDVTCWAGPNRHLVHYEIAGGSLLNIALSVEDGATSPKSNVPTDDAVVRELAASLCSTPRSIVALGRDWRSWTLVDRDPIDRWSAGRVVLLGDAAHPSLHYLAQGACQAFEDAVLLADLLRDAATSDLPRRLARYCRLRERRCKWITFGAREMVQYLNAEGDDAIRRDSWMSLLSSTEIYGKLAWLHGRRPKVPC
jgi:2-polyprenyl-6-methoxyphenol hydroxylase-like FAD-dependent oxidoreductase